MDLLKTSQDREKALTEFKHTRYRLPRLMILVLLNIIVLLETPLLLNISNASDYVYHTEASAAIAQGINIDEAGGPCDRCPHHLYQYLTIVIEALLPGENFKAAVLLASLLACIVLGLTMAISFHRLLRGRHPWQAVALALALMVIGPVLIFSLTSGTFQQSFVYLHPISYHNPTMTLLRPLAVIIFLYGASALIPPMVAWSHVALAALVTFLSGNAKPSFNIAFAPGAFVVLCYRFMRSRFSDYRVLLAIIGMMLLLLGLQYLAAFNPEGGDTGVAFVPFEFLMRRGFTVPDILLKHLLSFAMPLAIFVLYWRDARTDGPLGLAWVVFLFGLFFELIVNESGGRKDHGNFYWTGEITLFVLFFASVHFWLRAMNGRLDFQSGRARVVWVIGALHLISGIYWYLLHLLS